MLAAGTLAMCGVLWLGVDAPIADKRTFVFYFLVSSCAGLVLRRIGAGDVHGKLVIDTTA